METVTSNLAYLSSTALAGSNCLDRGCFVLGSVRKGIKKNDYTSVKLLNLHRLFSFRVLLEQRGVHPNLYFSEFHFEDLSPNTSVLKYHLVHKPQPNELQIDEPL